MNTIRFTEALIHSLPLLQSGQTSVTLTSTKQVITSITYQSAPLQISKSKTPKQRPPNTIFFDDENTRELPHIDLLPSSPKTLTSTGRVVTSIEISSPQVQIVNKKPSRPKSTETGPRALFFDDEICIDLPHLNLPVGEIPSSPKANFPLESLGDDPYRGGAPVFHKKEAALPEPPLLPETTKTPERLEPAVKIPPIVIWLGIPVMIAVIFFLLFG